MLVSYLALLLAMPVLYVLSIGPVYALLKLVISDPISRFETVYDLYGPVLDLCRRSEWFRDCINWWLELWNS